MGRTRRRGKGGRPRPPDRGVARGSSAQKDPQKDQELHPKCRSDVRGDACTPVPLRCGIGSSHSSRMAEFPGDPPLPHTSSLVRWWSFTSSDRCRSVRSRHHRSPFRLTDCSVGSFTAGLFGLRAASQSCTSAKSRLSTNLPLCYEDFSTRGAGRRADCGKLGARADQPPTRNISTFGRRFAVSESRISE